VTRDVPDYGFVLGVPARPQGWVCQCGVRLAFAGAEAVCEACGRGYTLGQAQQVELSTPPGQSGA
jgi:UDP-2-acetamido-3-amino-2,3-dideoxy-glucuronate N-acetyltransferase